MNSFKVDRPALWHFLGAYLHQDWREEHESTDAAFQDFLASEPQDASRIAAELQAVLESDRDEAALENLVLEGGSFYVPSNDGISTSEWLDGLLKMCRER